MSSLNNLNYFEIILLDINATIDKNKIICTTKNLYDAKYCAISYRWGELQEQLVKTPKYTAYVTSFDIEDLYKLCNYIKVNFNKSYLWIDSISINQLDWENKKQTIYRMNEIYKNAEKVICVPDLHKKYLINNDVNNLCYTFLRKNISTFKKILNDKELQDKIKLCMEKTDNICYVFFTKIKTYKIKKNKYKYDILYIKLDYIYS